MNERPKINIEKSIVDKMVEVLILAGVLVAWIYPATYYASLPDTIPIHFNAAGEADGFGSKSTLWMLPSICTVVVAMLIMLSRIPHVLNYPVKINSRNAELQYRLAIQLLRYLGLSLVVVFVLIEVTSINYAKNGASTGGAWTFPVILIVIFSPIVFFVVKMLASKNK